MSVLSLFLFTIVVDVVSELAKVCILSEMSHADNLVLMRETIEGHRNKFMNFNEDFESKGFKIILI